MAVVPAQVRHAVVLALVWQVVCLGHRQRVHVCPDGDDFFTIAVTHTGHQSLDTVLAHMFAHLVVPLPEQRCYVFGGVVLLGRHLRVGVDMGHPLFHLGQQLCHARNRFCFYFTHITSLLHQSYPSPSSIISPCFSGRMIDKLFQKYQNLSI